jgi:hypothetical protein
MRGACLWACTLGLACGGPPIAGPQAPSAPPPSPTALEECSGARTIDMDGFAAMTERMRPGISEADFRARAQALFGESEDSTFVRMAGLCWSASFILRNGSLVDVWFDARKSDDEGLNEAEFQSMRRTAEALVAALKKRHGAPARTSAGPLRLPSASTLAASEPPKPFLAAWASRDVELCLTLQVSIGKGVRDAALRFQEKPARQDWAWSC